jgi:hypothetical protein
VDHWAGPTVDKSSSSRELQQLLIKMEDDLLKNLASGGMIFFFRTGIYEYNTG